MGLMLSINSTHLNPALTILRWHCSCSPVHLSTVQCVSRTTSLIHCQLKFHTHILLLLHPFNGLFSGTTCVSWYQKDKISLDLMRQEILFLGMAVASAGLYANNLRLAPDRQPTTPITHFTGRMLFLAPSQQCQHLDQYQGSRAAHQTVLFSRCCSW